MNPRLALSSCLLLVLAGCHLKRHASVDAGTSGPAVPGPSCSADLDCATCSAPACGCGLKVTAVCPPTKEACFADPCWNSSASCSRGHCVVNPGAASPCATDDDCEVRDDDCQCDVFAALKTAQPSKACAGRGCATRPAKSGFHARCDVASKRCVLR